MASQQTTAVLEVAGVQWASEKATVERVLGRRPGVLGVEANLVGQTATVTYDPARTSVADLAAFIRDCGYHCAGQSVPRHVCDPAAEPQPHGPAGDDDGHRPHVDAGGVPHGHGDHGTGHGGHAGTTAQEAMGHGGHHAGMSMDDMTRDMRNRFLAAALLSLPILLWSPI